jgi:hypothetical protein
MIVAVTNRERALHSHRLGFPLSLSQDEVIDNHLGSQIDGTERGCCMDQVQSVRPN